MAGTYPLLITIRPSYYNEEPKEFPGSKTEYPDGGADYRGNGSSGIRRWTINYSSPGGLTESQALQFASLANSNQYSAKEGSMLGFDFTPRGESLLSGVRFDEGGFTIRRGIKSDVWMVEVKLIKRP